MSLRATKTFWSARSLKTFAPESRAVPSFIPEVLFFATALVYVTASILFVAHLMGIARGFDALRVAPPLVGLGALLHGTHIVITSFVLKICPVQGIHFGLSLVSMLACLVYVIMRRSARIDIVGAFVAPLALTFLLASKFVSGGALGDEPSTRVKSAILPIHVAVNLLGEALFMLAFAAAALYLMQENRLKQKKLEGIFQRLPPLDALDRAEHRFLLAGFPLLTIGILTGTLWARRVEAGNPADIWRAAFGYLSWLLFAGVLLLRAAAGWRGRRAAYGTIAGFGFALLVLLLYLFRATPAGPVVAKRGLPAVAVIEAVSL
jgi:ABC-type uncharacterized transport system permease subunit